MITDTTNNVDWPSTDTKTISSPICLNQNNEFVYRECLDGQWDTSPTCSSTQKDTLPQCPDKFVDAGTMCYILTNETPFPPQCPSEDVLPFELYKDIVTEDNLGPVWVPAKREGLNFMRWLEPSWLYKTEITDYQFTKPLKEKHCLIYFEKEFLLVSCNDTYRGVCAYRKLDQIKDNLCGSFFTCTRSTFSPKSKCFCYAPALQFLDYPLAEFTEPYQYNIYKILSNDTCAIGLTKNTDGKYVWSRSKSEIAYTFWSSNATFGDTYIFGAGTPNGWVLTQTLLACSIFAKYPESDKPSLEFVFNETNYRFSLTVVNPDKLKSYKSGPLIFCFASTNGLKLGYVYPTLKKIRSFGDSVLYAIDPWKNASGDYWCQAFRLSDLQIIETEKIFLRPNNDSEFVGLFKIRYQDDINPLSQDGIAMMVSGLVERVEYPGVEDIKVMEIVDWDEDQQLLSVNVHLISTVQILADEWDNHFLALKVYLEDVYKEDADVALVDFLSSDFCSSEHGDNLTWPKAPIGSVVSPVQFCFKPDGSPVTRACEGDFVNGGRWSNFDDCEIFTDSRITPKLRRIFNTSNQLIDEIEEVSQNYHLFTSLDVYLVATVYSEYLYMSNIHGFVHTINNILKIDKTILKEAQLKMKATDKLLHSIDNVNFALRKTFEYNLDNFVFMSLNPTELSGLVVTQKRQKLVVGKLVRDYTFDKITKIKNLESAIWVSPDFRKSAKRITISMYVDDAFFPQNETVTTSVVFNIVSPEYFNGPVYIVRRNDHRHHHQSQQDYCAFWGYSLRNQGSWKYLRKAKVSADFSVCSFWYPANSAIVTLDNDNDHDNPDVDSVTDDLKDLLQSNDSVPETMEKLSIISEKYRHFEPVDLSFVGKILQRVRGHDEVNFTNLATTISNIQQVDRDILMQSQVQGLATDTILAHVDYIIKNHNFDDLVEVKTDNFVILVVEVTANFSGVGFFRRHDSLEPVILDVNVSIDDVFDKDFFDSAVLLSPELQNQVGVAAKVIVTLYLNDALFNERAETEKCVSKIFGVILPEMEEFAGPISIIYRSNETTNQGCVYWHYDYPRNISGSWQQDGDPKNSSELVRCDFWHTTHFAYLILDEDKFDRESHDIFDFLSLLTYVNCIISFLGLTCIVLTAVFFRQWRDNTGNKILLNFTFVIMIQIVVFYISNTISEEYKGYIQCTVVGILLHYSIVSQFCWMFVIAILQFRRFVIVLDGPPKFVLLKACVCGWVLPLLPVVCVFTLDQDNYVNSNVGLCYPSDLGLYLGVWLPICIIILINFVLFSITLYNVVHKKTESVTGSGDALYQWRLAVLLFFMLGFTWCFGFLAELRFGLVFEYLFCMTATLQGFTLFLFFIVLNANTRCLYVTAVGRCCKRKSR